MLVYAVTDAREPNTQALKETFGQRAHLERLAVLRRYPEYCADEADFVGKILADVYRHFGIAPPAVKPQNLPYPSLGTLFKGREEFLAQLRSQLTRGATTVIRVYGEVHPTVANRLNNLAGLLHDTKRLPEAEPLMRRGVEILLAFTRDTGHQHPYLNTLSRNYLELLGAMGDTRAMAEEKVRALSATYGVSV
jgi:hypothetical protein